ncbi:hypothetical protein BpHYR1_002173 [Brachionus plicatilis]|uniref:Uncharacterized protein n=1 Tax=Brachionus plicatilis TaxID=10195 RepID=A0A3M7Q9C3_BRAPC|nr:hypothetical protein BpHYR1_002173 [Brachionus plicatilis]
MLTAKNEVFVQHLLPFFTLFYTNLFYRLMMNLEICNTKKKYHKDLKPKKKKIKSIKRFYLYLNIFEFYRNSCISMPYKISMVNHTFYKYSLFLLYNIYTLGQKIIHKDMFCDQVLDSRYFHIYESQINFHGLKELVDDLVIEVNGDSNVDAENTLDPDTVQNQSKQKSCNEDNNDGDDVEDDLSHIVQS